MGINFDLSFKMEFEKGQSVTVLIETTYGRRLVADRFIMLKCLHSENFAKIVPLDVDL